MCFLPLPWWLFLLGLGVAWSLGMTPGTTIAIAAIVFAVLVFIDVLRANRAQRLLGPASPEPDEHEACHGDPELLRAIGEPGMINHFHNGSSKTNSEQDHA